MESSWCAGSYELCFVPFCHIFREIWAFRVTFWLPTPLASFNSLRCILSMQIWYRWIALVVLIILSLFSCPSDTYSGRYEHFSLSLRRVKIDGQIRQLQALLANRQALFNNLNCVFSMQIWCRWIALVVLVIPSLFSCPSDTYSGRYEHLSLALRRD